MPTCQDVVSHALRLGGVVGIDDIAEAGEGLFAQAELLGMFTGWFEQGMFGTLTDVTKTAAYTANEFERVNAATGITVTLPLTITNDNARAPYDLAAIMVVQDGAAAQWIYDRAWVRLDTLGLTSICPLSARNMAGLAACLALRITPFDNKLDPRTNKNAVDFRTSLMLKARPQTVEFF